MSVDILAELAAFAAAPSARAPSATRACDLSLEDARKVVKISAEEPKAKTSQEFLDGKQFVGLKFGQTKLVLDPIQKGLARLAVPAASVEAVTVQLQGLIDGGAFDEQIVAGQVKIKEMTAASLAKKAASLAKATEAVAESNDEVAPAVEASSEAPSGVDLDAMEGDLDLG